MEFTFRICKVALVVDIDINIPSVVCKNIATQVERSLVCARPFIISENLNETGGFADARLDGYDRRERFMRIPEDMDGLSQGKGKQRRLNVKSIATKMSLTR